MRGDDPAADDEAEAAAFDGMGGVAAEKRLEKPRLLAGWNTGAGVGDGQFGGVAGAVWRPAPSGPRWAMRSSIRCKCARASAADEDGSIRPAMPHMVVAPYLASGVPAA